MIPTKETNGNEHEYSLRNSHQNQIDIKNRRIEYLEKSEREKEKELIELKHKLIDLEGYITELESYKEGLEKENRRIIKNNIPMKLREIDSEILSKL